MARRSVLPPVDRDNFRSWLGEATDMTVRSTNDVCSRLNRLAPMVNIDRIDSEIELEVALIRSADFAKHSTVIKSQLRRAAKLYLQFLDSKQKAVNKGAATK